DIFLSSAGSLSFTSLDEQELQFSLLDVNGKLITTINQRTYSEGRNTVQCKSLVPGMYFVKVNAGYVIKVFAN
ncbi:MAG TPA: T9SS type A sorting domain-containing protein, partial [Saprospiraceae bacterium]